MARTAKSRLTYLDTHVVCWLYEGRNELLSVPAANAIERGLLRVSPMVDLELRFLREIGRLSKGPETILPALSRDIGLAMGEEAFSSIALEARGLGWTRDPFDRLIVAEAALMRATLVTRDAAILKNYSRAVW